MSFQINTNTSALGALRNLNLTGNAMAQSVQRLSTGLRINSGADDPSGLIASETYRAQISGLDQAGRNVQNATNFAKTAEGGLSEVSRLLQTARTLAVANGDASLDNSQKQANQTQLDSILASVSRIANQTQFGSKHLLDGSNGASGVVSTTSLVKSMNLQGVANGAAVTQSGSVSVDFSQSGNHAASQATVSSSASYTASTVTVGAGSFSVNGKTFTTSTTTTAADVVNLVNSATSDTGVTASLNSSTHHLDFKHTEYGSDHKITVADSFGLLNGSSGTAQTATGTDAAATVTIGGTYTPGAPAQPANVYVIGEFGSSSSVNDIILPTGPDMGYRVNGVDVMITAGSTTFQDFVDAVNANVSGVHAIWNPSDTAVHILSNASGASASFTLALLDAAHVGSGAATITGSGGGGSLTGGTQVTFNKGKGLQLQDADGNVINLTTQGNATTAPTTVGMISVNASSSFQIGANAGQTANLTLGNFTAASLGLSSLDIVNNSSAALTAIDTAIGSVSTARGRVGSFVKNTLEAQGRNLGVAKENMQAADSTIRDLDVAQEMTSYSKLQILSQAGLSVLAQANSAQQGVLSLLRG